MMRNDKDYKLALDKTTYRAIKMQTNTDIDIEKYINDCINEYIGSSGNGLFNSDNKYFWSESFFKRMQVYEEIKQKRKEAGLKGLEKRWGKKDIKKKSYRKLLNCCKSIANAKYFNSKCHSKSIANAIETDSKPIAKNSKLNEIKLNKTNNNILLNYTKLNLLFNYLINKEQHFENLNEMDKQSIIFTLERLEIYSTSFPYITENKLLEYKIQYWTIMEIYLSPYKVYLNKLNRIDFLFRFQKTMKYVDYNNENELQHFIGYFIKSLQEELRNNETIKK